MFRKFCAAAIGLALCLPVLTVAPVAAFHESPVPFVHKWTDGDGTHVVGLVRNHTNSRRTGIEVTATFHSSPGPETETGPIFVTNLAPHASSPFHLIENDSDVSGGFVEVSASGGTVTSVRPVGALEIGEPSAVVADSVTVDITNESNVLAEDVQVYALAEGSPSDAAASPALDVPANTTVPFTITFDPDSNPDPSDVMGLIAETTSGAFLTSWNNYFGDLGNSRFSEEIAFIADEGITTGCGNANFCPKSNVSRAQMAVFLTRALGLSDTSDFGFADIGHLSPSFQDAINAIANEGIAGGCATSPLRYCPDQAVTRGQMSKFIVLGYELTVVQTDAFTDDDGHFSEDYNDTMWANNITGGCATEPFRYCPNRPVLREEMAAFIFRAEN